jgi:hypothetical protein
MKASIDMASYKPLPWSLEVLIVSGMVMATSIAVHLAEAGVRNVIPLESNVVGS